MLTARKRFPSPSSTSPVPSRASAAPATRLPLASRAAPCLLCTPRGSQTEVRREQGRGDFVSLGIKVGAASRGGFVSFVGCRLQVFCFHLLVLFCMCWHAHSFSHNWLFSQLALSIGFSHNWLCQRFTDANTRLLTTHLEFSSLSRAPPGLALSLRHTLHVLPPSDAGGCPCLMSLIDTMRDTMRDTAQNEQIQSQRSLPLTNTVTPIDKYIVLL
jgi:hypothetical protein